MTKHTVKTIFGDIQLDTSFESVLSRYFEKHTPSTSTASFTAYDIIEFDDHYIINVEVPGVKKDDINIEVVDDTLHITSDGVGDTYSESYKYVKQRRKVDRSINISVGMDDSIDSDSISATCEHGLLVVKLSLKNKEKKKIEIT